MEILIIDTLLFGLAYIKNWQCKCEVSNTAMYKMVAS